jgi:hypothetical protein
MESNCWLDLSGKCLYDVPIGYYGYIYKISVIKHKSIPKELWGKCYIGKKAFTHATKKKVSKKVIKETKTRQRVVRSTKDSGWLQYFGSSKELLEDIKTYGKEYFKREIICFCKSKAELTYFEAYWQFMERVLLIDSYNKWISCKVYKHLLNK